MSIPNNKSPYFAEVLESSLNTIRAQCWHTEHVPAHGALVAITDAQITLYALVYNCTTGSDNAVHAPYAYGKTPEQLHQEHPEIFMLLKTTFWAILIGYQEHHNMVYSCAQRPAPIHTFVRPATSEEYANVFARADALYALFGSGQLITNLDELLLALLKQIKIVGVLTPLLLETLVNTYTAFYAHDYRRVRVFAQRVQATCETLLQ